MLRLVEATLIFFKKGELKQVLKEPKFYLQNSIYYEHTLQKLPFHNDDNPFTCF